ncbi:MAG TPA: hypothetical protein DCY40_09995 [Actinobacteria bacterium]|nr:hypothetical protein [Actinomycetota bacterium]
MHRVIERIINLLAFLLTVGRPVTADEIRHTVAGYDEKSDEAFRRTFERDKDLIRGLGVPLRLAFTDRFEVEKGYAIRPEEYALPDPGLTDEERAALWLAARMARLGGDGVAPSAIFKLGGAAATSTGDPLSADLGADATVLEALFGAVVERRRVRFRYRERERRAAPYGLVHRRGHWYLVAGVGKENRTFRVDRIADLEVEEEPAAFERPPGFRAADGFPEAPWEAGVDEIEAVVRFDAATAWWAHRQLGADTPVTEHPDGAITARMRVASPEAFIGWLIGFEDGAVLESPAELRSRFVEHVRGPS